MKKRIFLSLVSFFMMTAMWASLVDAYQIYLTGANGKTYGTAELTLNMKNRNAISGWACTIVLPAGVTFQSAAIVDGRYPDGATELVVTPSNGDNSVKIAYEGTEGVALTGTDGAVATITVAIAGDATLGDNTVLVKSTVLTGADGTLYQDKKTEGREFTWTIEEGESPIIPGDANGDGDVDAADFGYVLNLIADEDFDAKADFNGDNKIDSADAQTVLNVLADQ